MGKFAASSHLAVRCDGGSGCRLVHRPVLRTVLSAIDPERECDVGKLHRRNSIADGDAVLRFLWLAERSNRTEMDNSCRMLVSGFDLFADL